MADDELNAEDLNIEEPSAEEISIDESSAKEPPKDEPSAEEPSKDEPEAEELTVEGFLFQSKEDADKARLDARKIQILGQKVKTTRVSDLEDVYEKAISNKIFATPIGWVYLSVLRSNLIEAGVDENELTPIPVTQKFTNILLKDEYNPRRYATPVKKKKRDPKASMILSVVFNIILVILVVAMFFVALNSDNDNILNYKQNVTNRYAEWEQSLKEREKAVRDKERELGIIDNTNFDQGE